MTPKQVIEFFGGVSEAAEALNVSYQAVRFWREGGKVPAGRQYQIQIITGGKLKAEKKAA